MLFSNLILCLLDCKDNAERQWPVLLLLSIVIDRLFFMSNLFKLTLHCTIISPLLYWYLCSLLLIVTSCNNCFEQNQHQFLLLRPYQRQRYLQIRIQSHLKPLLVNIDFVFVGVVLLAWFFFLLQFSFIEGANKYTCLHGNSLARLFTLLR